MFDQDKLKISRLVSSSPYKSDASVSYGEYQGKPVVVKRGKDELTREAEILRHIKHPSFPKVIELVDNGSSGTLILERLQGISLDTYIDLNLDNNSWHSQPMTFENASTIVDSLADSFEALKSAGYLYRDLNLNHILVNDDRINLVDVEWSVPLDSNGKAIVDSEAGTWETMAPEEFEVGNTMTEASAVYTLGVVLAQLLTGDNPFHILKESIPDATARRRATCELHRNIPILKLENDDIAAFLRACLAPNPVDRFQNIQQFKSEYMRLMN